MMCGSVLGTSLAAQQHLVKNLNGSIVQSMTQRAEISYILDTIFYLKVCKQHNLNISLQKLIHISLKIPAVRFQLIGIRLLRNLA